MTKQPYIYEASESNFDSLVLDNSNQLPVVVEFMDVSSEACVIQDHRIQQWATEFAGQFIFAKVDIYEQPDLAKAFRIEQLPTTMVFVKGDIQQVEVGQMSLENIATMLRKYGVYRQSDDLRLQARELYLAGQTTEAMTLLTQAAQSDPSNTRVAMDMTQILLDLDQLDTALTLFNQLPDHEKQSETGRALIGQLTFKQLAANTPGLVHLTKELSVDSTQAKTRFELALCLVAAHQYDDAMQHLFELQTSQPDFENGAVKEMIITLCNMLAPNEPSLAQSYRQKLNSLLN